MNSETFFLLMMVRSFFALDPRIKRLCPAGPAHQTSTKLLAAA
jgi:hypothetical protein